MAFGENLTNNGTLSGSGSFQLPSSHIEVGELSPGSSPGILTIIGDLTTAPEATFNIEIDGTTAGTEYDQIIVTNEAILDGTINVTLGYLPANDASFEIVTASNLSSCNFPAQVTGNYNNTDYTFDVVCQNNTLYLNGPGVALSDTNFEVNQIKVYPNPTNNKLFINTNSIKNGQWKLYSQLGQLIKQGKITQEKTEIYLHGTLLAKGLIDENQKRQGYWEEYYEDGQLKFEGHYLQGEYNGTVAEWYPNGQAYSLFNYDSGVEVGPQKAWQANGKYKANYVVIGDRKYGLIARIT